MWKTILLSLMISGTILLAILSHDSRVIAPVTPEKPIPRLTIDLELLFAEEDVNISIFCGEIFLNNSMYLQCVNDQHYWGMWEVFVVRENNSVDILWSTVYNDSTGGGPFTTNPIHLIIVFYHRDGRIVTKDYYTKNMLKPCLTINMCSRA